MGTLKPSIDLSREQKLQYQKNLSIKSFELVKILEFHYKKTFFITIWKMANCFFLLVNFSIFIQLKQFCFRMKTEKAFPVVANRPNIWKKIFENIPTSARTSASASATASRRSCSGRWTRSNAPPEASSRGRTGSTWVTRSSAAARCQTRTRPPPASTVWSGGLELICCLTILF